MELYKDTFYIKNETIDYDILDILVENFKQYTDIFSPEKIELVFTGILYNAFESLNNTNIELHLANRFSIFFSHLCNVKDDQESILKNQVTSRASDFKQKLFLEVKLGLDDHQKNDFILNYIFFKNINKNIKFESVFSPPIAYRLENHHNEECDKLQELFNKYLL